MRTMTFLSAALLLAACSGDAGKEEDDCGVELASIYPEDGATGVPVDDLVVLVELSPSDAFGDVDVLDPDGVSVWGNIGKSPIEVEFLFGDILPDTEYTVEMNLAPGEGELYCNELTTTFTTGSAR